MTKSFGPVVVCNEVTREVERVHCNWCIFRTWRDGQHACSHVDRDSPRPIPDPNATPDWCQMRAGAVKDASDMANGVEHKVFRWSGRRTDEPRVIYCGIPSEAHRQFRLAKRDMKRGAVRLVDETGAEIARHPEEAA